MVKKIIKNGRKKKKSIKYESKWTINECVGLCLREGASDKEQTCYFTLSMNFDLAASGID